MFLPIIPVTHFSSLLWTFSNIEKQWKNFTMNTCIPTIQLLHLSHVFYNIYFLSFYLYLIYFSCLHFKVCCIFDTLLPKLFSMHMSFAKHIQMFNQTHDWDIELKSFIYKFSLFEFNFVMISGRIVSYYFPYDLGIVKGGYGPEYEENWFPLI